MRSTRGYLSLEKRTLLVVTLQNGEVIRDYLTQAQVRELIKTQVVIGVKKVLTSIK